ncbi:unnamed protein product [Cochlearia groenlandica]
MSERKEVFKRNPKRRHKEEQVCPIAEKKLDMVVVAVTSRYGERDNSWRSNGIMPEIIWICELFHLLSMRLLLPWSENLHSSQRSFRRNRGSFKLFSSPRISIYNYERSISASSGEGRNRRKKAKREKERPTPARRCLAGVGERR